MTWTLPPAMSFVTVRIGPAILKRRILDALDGAELLTVEIAGKCRVSTSGISSALSRMRKAGVVEKRHVRVRAGVAQRAYKYAAWRIAGTPVSDRFKPPKPVPNRRSRPMRHGHFCTQGWWQLPPVALRSVLCEDCTDRAACLQRLPEIEAVRRGEVNKALSVGLATGCFE